MREESSCFTVPDRKVESRICEGHWKRERYQKDIQIDVRRDVIYVPRTEIFCRVFSFVYVWGEE